MGLRQQANGVSALQLLPALTITTAVAATAATPILNLEAMKYLVVQAAFVYGSGGTTATAYVQTSLDIGASWVDIMSFQFTTASATKVSAVVWSTALAAVYTPTDGALTVNTITSGLLGDRLRVKYVTTGTYAGGTTLTLLGWAKG